jgi:hypothetical protein
MKRLLLYIFSRQTALVVSVYALLAKLLFTADAPYATLVALFLALVGQLGHRALGYYGSMRDAVKDAVGDHGDKLDSLARDVAAHGDRLKVAELNVARVAQTIDKRGLGY